MVVLRFGALQAGADCGRPLLSGEGMTWSWPWYFGMAAALIASHSLPTLPVARRVLVRGLGERTYLTLYSLLSLAVLTGFVGAYVGIGSGPQLYLPPPAAPWVAVLLMPVAVFLMLARVTTRAPWSAGRDAGKEPNAAAPGGLGEIHGIYRLTRVPGSLGLLLWVALHLLNTGDLRRVVLFLVLGAIALLAILKNEFLLRRAKGTRAAAYLATTSLFPGAALLSGRQERSLSDIAWWRPVAALLIYAVLLLAHPYILGVDPLLGL